ncbi:helix-turn-helix domain-containing protein [Actinomadura sp. KC345]|uniref:winged helix-turn-helix transcriptional regulator n=1 Tax=Actinomadura sp. KC345 TaxID=2530371 RepID=UPI001A9E23D9|nr:helix-turn-helix domain-containing protein [Actinomadura sp. KC345]
MTIALEGHFADRDAWSMQNCPVARTLAALGPPSAVLVLSEAYFGTNRFGDFVRNLAMTESAVTARLRHLVKAGLLSREPYQEPGQRTRYEYHLTKMGQDLAPTLVGLMEWGETYLPGDEGRQVRLTHAGCGKAVTSQVRCADGHDVGVDEIIMGPPNLDEPQNGGGPARADQTADRPSDDG